MQKIYIVRKFTVTSSGPRHYYEEEVFNHIDLALKFVAAISNEDNDSFLSEMITCDLNNEDIDKDKDVKIYDLKGNIIWSSECDYNIHDMNECCKNYKIGDIVKILPFPWNPFSPIWVQTLGVVSMLPTTNLAERQDYGMETEYIVEYIVDGYLSHLHVKEQAFQKNTEDIPENMYFLNILSDHYKGIKYIPENILHAIRECEIFVEKIQHYKF